jgi:hypothetical protein
MDKAKDIRDGLLEMVAVMLVIGMFFAVCAVPAFGLSYAMCWGIAATPRQTHIVDFRYGWPDFRCQVLPEDGVWLDAISWRPVATANEAP